MKKRYYIPIYSYADCDDDVIGYMYFGRARHRHYVIWHDTNDAFIGCNIHYSFTKNQIHQLLKELKNSSAYKIQEKQLLQMLYILGHIKSFDRPLSDELVSDIFSEIKFSRKYLYQIAAQIINFKPINMIKLVRTHIVPCRVIDHKIIVADEKDDALTERELKKAQTIPGYHMYDDCHDSTDNSVLYLSNLSKTQIVNRFKKDLHLLCNSNH